uniref:Uncharacterized protein n=1 Tax=Sphaerodactylus townsendi TaxID=933632 RepID=A0ACB8EJU4_9SAUR
MGIPIFQNVNSEKQLLFAFPRIDARNPVFVRKIFKILPNSLSLACKLTYYKGCLTCSQGLLQLLSNSHCLPMALQQMRKLQENELKQYWEPSISNALNLDLQDLKMALDDISPDEEV